MAAYFGCDMSDKDITPEAKKKGVCHTFEECDLFYKSLSPELKQPAIDHLREKIPSDEMAVFKRLREKHGTDWFDHIYDEQIEKMSEEDKRRGFAAMLNAHHSVGMAVRNCLRQGKFGEEYFRCHNLDDIYQYLLDEAVAA